MQNYIGQQIDRYRIIERLGMGGMAVVYKAYDTRLEREVALKLIRTDEIPPSQLERLMKRFEREAKSQARFTHRNIVPIYDYGEVDGSPYLVMAYISGDTLKVKMQGPIDWRQAVRWLIPVADALSYAHKRGVIHRDIKPSNILFDDEDQPILTDFGIAKILETEEATLTGTGMGVGTPEYMAPEQWRGQAFPATDQYALGVVLYELITGQKPYSADTPAAVAIQQATEPLKAPSRLVDGIPEAVEKVLYKALANNSEDRYADMGEFRKALSGLLTAGIEQSAAAPAVRIKTPVPVVKKAIKPMRGSEEKTYDLLDQTPAEGFRQSANQPENGGMDTKLRKKTSRKRQVVFYVVVVLVLLVLVLITGLLVINRFLKSDDSVGKTATAQQIMVAEGVALLLTQETIDQTQIALTIEPGATDTVTLTPILTETVAITPSPGLDLILGDGLTQTLWPTDTRQPSPTPIIGSCTYKVNIEEYTWEDRHNLLSLLTNYFNKSFATPADFRAYTLEIISLNLYENTVAKYYFIDDGYEMILPEIVGQDCVVHGGEFDGD